MSVAHDRRRVFAMGGGGFAAPPGDPALDEYVLECAGRPNPRICLLPTAGGDAEDQIRRFYAAYRALPCEPTHLSLFRLGTRPVDVRTFLLAQDIVYVGGGSMTNLLAIWRAHGLDTVLREAWERGVLLCGFSAGSMCWFRAGVTTSFGVPRPAPGLGLLPASNSVHYDSEPERLPCYLEAVRSEAVPPGYAVADGVGLLFAGSELVEAVTARPGSRAYWVEEIAGEAMEAPLALEPLAAREATTTLSIAEFREARARRSRPNRPGARSAGVGD